MDEGFQNNSGLTTGAVTYDVHRLNEALFGERLNRVLVVGSIDSTNTALFELGLALEPEGLILVAEEQWAGRGRLGRSWVSPSGKSVLMSALVRANLEAAAAGLLNAAAGLAVVEAVSVEGGVTAALKWPNDIVYEGRKLGGILSESGTDRSGERFWVIGIGLNVNWVAEDFPPDIEESATSLAMAIGSPLDRDSLLIGLARSLGAAVSELEADQAGLLARYRRALSTLGRRIRAKLGSEELQGVAEDVDDSGDLIVKTDSGERRSVVAGDVTEVRPL